MLQNKISCSNTFDALVVGNEHGSKDDGKNVQDCDASSNTRQANSIGSGNEQQNSKKLAARLHVAKDLVPTDGRKEGQIVVVRDENNDSSNSCIPAKVNLTALGIKLLENLNPYQGVPETLDTSTKGFSCQEVKISDGIAGVGFNMSQHDIPSNELVDRSGNMLQASNNQHTLSMMSSATKTLKEAIEQSSEELDDRTIEQTMIKSKFWSDQVEEYEEDDDDPDKRYEEDDDVQLSKS